jgi:hypothetical protein
MKDGNESPQITMDSKVYVLKGSNYGEVGAPMIVMVIFEPA